MSVNDVVNPGYTDERTNLLFAWKRRLLPEEEKNAAKELKTHVTYNKLINTF